MIDKVTVFLPCRAGSERVPEKNIRPFARYNNGLIELKLRQLLGVAEVDEVLVSSNDSKVLEVAESFRESRITIDERPASLCQTTTSTDELIRYVPSIIENGQVLWTHVTSPFVDSNTYHSAILRYRKEFSDGFDSLMSVTPLRDFIWRGGRIINVGNSKLHWPRTQDLEVLYSVNNGIFLSPISVYKSMGNRVGSNPLLFELEPLAGFDIDWEADFLLAEKIAEFELEGV